MSETIEVSLNPKRQTLRLNCGQCGDVKDISFEIEETGRIKVIIFDAEDLTTEDDAMYCYQPIELIV